MKMMIILKSGESISLDVEKYDIQQSNLTGELTALEWKMPDGATRGLTYVRLDSIDAITWEDDLRYGDPCSVCGKDGWPIGSAGNAKAIHERTHARLEG